MNELKWYQSLFKELYDKYERLLEINDTVVERLNKHPNLSKVGLALILPTLKTLYEGLTNKVPLNDPSIYVRPIIFAVSAYLILDLLLHGKTYETLMGNQT